MSKAGVMGSANRMRYSCCEPFPMTTLTPKPQPLLQISMPSWVRSFITSCPPITFSKIEHFYELLKEIHSLEAVQMNTSLKFPWLLSIGTNHAVGIYSSFAPSGIVSSLSTLFERVVSLHEDRNESATVVMEEKIALLKNCGCVARIIGHRGHNIKQLQWTTDCYIAIRGKGSVKDELEEARLVGKPGWEHLREPLHVYIRAEDASRPLCVKKLAAAVALIESLLTENINKVGVLASKQQTPCRGGGGVADAAVDGGLKRAVPSQSPDSTKADNAKRRRSASS